ncbi:hypothetical protein BGZ63DRAFT_402068 [Mariannaea sp. PMI_226]|nr:hypothetical protein BGZ63DRAFT_402068 [Mariannaea sp. PMI_226]
MAAIPNSTSKLSRRSGTLSAEAIYSEQPAPGVELDVQGAVDGEEAEKETCLEWEVEGILDEQMIDGTKHYLMSWKPTLVAEYDARNAGKLIAEWKLLKAERNKQFRERRKRAGRHARP